MQTVQTVLMTVLTLGQTLCDVFAAVRDSSMLYLYQGSCHQADRLSKRSKHAQFNPSWPSTDLSPGVSMPGGEPRYLCIPSPTTSPSSTPLEAEPPPCLASFPGTMEKQGSVAKPKMEIQERQINSPIYLTFSS